MMATKILVVYRGELSKPSGTPIRILNFVKRLAADPSVDLAVFSWDKTFPGVPKHVHMDNNHVQDIKKICAYIKENDIKVVVAYIASFLYYLIPVKLFTGVKIIYETQGFIEDEARAYGDIGFFKYWFLKGLFGVCYWLCDAIATSEGPHTIKRLKKYNSNIIDLYGGIDLSICNPNIPKGKYITRDERIIIGYAGNVRIWQGVDFLVEAYKKISSESKDFRLVMLLSEKKEQFPDMEIVGPLPNTEAPSFMVDCDILVIPRPALPEMQYAVSGKLIEYLGMGKAIVVSNVGEPEKVITSGVNGLIYIAGDMNEFIKCIYSLRDEKLRARLGAEALKTAPEYSWDKLTERLIDEIHKLT